MEEEIKKINELLINHTINYMEQKQNDFLITFFQNLHEGFEKIYKEAFKNEKNTK